MEPFIGQIIMFGGNFAPRGWAFCDGQLLAISSHSALFSILGTTYGGDGRTTFGLPELRGRVAVHSGNGPGPGLQQMKLGQKGGSATTTLNLANLPAHTHTATVNSTLKLRASSATGNTDDPDGSTLAGGLDSYVSGNADVDLNSSMLNGGVTVQNSSTGSGKAFNNMQPYQGVNYIIALVGTYPSRS